jgi:anti-anti-sigma factor
MAAVVLARHASLHQGQPFEVRLEERGDAVALVFAGPVPAALPTPVMNRIVAETQTRQGRPAFIDLAGCSYLGSGAIACLMEFARVAAPQGGLPLVSPQPRAMTVLRMLGIASFFSVVADEAAARNAGRQRPPPG